MATKSAASTKKTSTAKKTTSSAAAKKSTVKSNECGVAGRGILYERDPSAHKLTGKYRFMFAFLALSTAAFAALSVFWAYQTFVIWNDYASVVSCARNHISCSVTVKPVENVVDEAKTEE